MNVLGVESSLHVGVTISVGMESLRVVNNQKPKDCSFLKTPLSSPNGHGGLSRGLSQVPKPLLLESFHVEGLTPSKMVKVHLVLESLRIRIVNESEKGLLEDSRRVNPMDKVYPRRKNKTMCGALGAT